MSLYLDASVVIPLFIVESRSAGLTNWIARSDETLIISDLVVAEVGAVVSRLVRTNKIVAAQSADVLRRFDEFRSDVTDALEHASADIRRAGQLVRNPYPKLLAADAIHLATCQRYTLTLVTHDIDLAAIAAREAIRCIRPE